MYFCLRTPSLRCAWVSFYMLKGSLTGGNVDKGKNGKRNCGWYNYLYSVSFLTLYNRWLHNLLPRAPGKALERHVGGCAGAWAQSGRLPRQRLAAAVVLSGPEACRSPDLAGTCGASRQVPWSALVGLPGKLLLPGPCLLSLNTLFLDGSKGTLEDLGVRPASLAAGCCNCPCTSSGY